MAGTMTNVFTTGTGVDLIQPTIVTVTPSGAGVSTTTNITVVFSKAMDAISFRKCGDQAALKH
jgi:hypothetical protein